MSARHAAAVLALAAACVAAAWGVARWRGASPAARAVAPRVPSEGLVLAIAGEDLPSALADLDRSAFWRDVLRAGGSARAFVPAGPGALALYGRGWLVIGARRARDGAPVSGRLGDWYAAASAADRLPPPDGSGEALAWPESGPAVTWTMGAASPSPVAQAWRGAFPARAAGSVDPRAGRERWKVSCAGPCLLDVLRSDPGAAADDALWAVVPPDAVGFADAVFEPERLPRALDVAALDDVERFMDVPVRRELARALAGHAVMALRGEPALGEPAAIVAAFDLARPDTARALVERALALGLLAGDVGIERYRDVTVGSWNRAPGGSVLRPAVAVDGDALLVATRKRDLLAAIDRRREARRTEAPARARLEALGPAPWRGWSRSSFLATQWLELVTGRRAEAAVPAADVAARLVRRDGAWWLESDGSGPAFAAEPVLPSARSILGAWRAAP